MANLKNYVFSSMPKKCCVLGCKSNYKSENTKTISAFRFPRDEVLKNKWLHAIPRKGFVPSETSVVCHKHFSEDVVIRIDRVTRDDGSILSVARKTPKLAPNSVPHIFPDPPPRRKKKKTALYQIVNPSIQKIKQELLEQMIECKPSEQIVKCEQVIKCEPLGDEVSNAADSDVIGNFHAFTKNLLNCELDFGFKASMADNYVLFYKLSHEDCFQLFVSVKVFDDFSLKIWHEDNLLPIELFKWIFENNCKLKKWSQLYCLINYLNSYS